jgi:Icc-related predicted phosphoesterase
MKILCVSDQIDPLIYTDTVKQRYTDVDFILSAGDLPIEYLDYIANNLEKPLLFVFGNHEAGDSSSHKNGGAYIDAKVRHRNKLIVAGLGGVMRHNRGENQFTDFEMSIRILKLFPALFFNRIFRGRFLDILLTHAPPQGIHDKEEKCHSGFKCFLWFTRVFKPRYHVHGHVHHYDHSEPRETKYHKTFVINVYSHYLIDTNK